MNTQKLNVVLGAVFAVLTILSIIKFTSSATVFVDYSEVPRLIPGFTPQNVHIIQLERGAPDEDAAANPEQPAPQEEVIQLLKDGEKWLLMASEYGRVQLTARGSQIEDRILKKIEKLEVNISTIVASDVKEAELEKYGFGPDSWTVTCYDANRKELAKLQIGRKAGREGDEGATKVSGSFVKRADQSTVLVSDAPFDLYEKPGDWLDKQVLSVEESEVQRIHLQNEKGELLLERISKKDEKAAGEETSEEETSPTDPQEKKPADAEPTPGWKVVRGPEKVGKLRDYAVSTLLSRATNVTAKSFLKPLDQQALGDAGLLQPPIRVSIVLRDESGTTKEIRIGERVEGEQAYRAATTDSQMIFTLPEWEVAEFEKAPKDFFDALPEPEQPAGGNDAKEGQSKEQGEVDEQKAPDADDDPKKDDPKKDDPKKDDPKKDAGDQKKNENGGD